MLYHKIRCAVKLFGIKVILLDIRRRILETVLIRVQFAINLLTVGMTWTHISGFTLEISLVCTV